jgi:hypothetical protein
MDRVFRPAGEVSSAVFLKDPPPFTTIKSYQTKAQKDGLRYERRTQDYLEKLLHHGDGGSEFVLNCNPWILYFRRTDRSAACFCQPDALLIGEEKIIIVEIKLSHTDDSYKQMRLLYEPVLKKIFKEDKEFALLEICKWYDPHTQFTETFYYCEKPLEAISGKLGIHIYKPRGRGIVK